MYGLMAFPMKAQESNTYCLLHNGQKNPVCFRSYQGNTGKCKKKLDTITDDIFCAEFFDDSYFIENVKTL